MNFTVNSCKPGDVQASFEVVAGLMQTVGKPCVYSHRRNDNIKDHGVPYALDVQVQKKGQSSAVEAGCKYKVPAGIAALQTRAYGPYGRCSQCYKCMVATQFKCSDTYVVRIKARGASSGKIVASGWSEDFEFTPDCSAEAKACFSG